jgi:hypothetical protein
MKHLAFALDLTCLALAWLDIIAAPILIGFIANSLLS